MILYWALWVILRAYFFGILRVRVEGLQHLPRRGGAVLCSNHFSWADPLLLGAVLPRHLFYMTKVEAFASPAASAVLRSLGAFPVRRHRGDRGAIRRALGLLGAGRIVAVVPEGTRSRDGRLGPAEPGAALLGLWSGKQIVPVAIRGRYGPGRLTVRLGEPFELQLPGDRKPTAAELQAMAEEQIMGAVRRLLREPPAARGPRVAIGRA
jgi:1-acyl-sn-glycerol-3-phosphate acyltransferase